MIVNVGTSTIPHYVGGGTVKGITTTVFPDGCHDLISLLMVINSTSIKSNVNSTIAHTHAGGGEMYVGFTTTIFPDVPCDLYHHSIPSANQLHIQVGLLPLLILCLRWYCF